MAGTNAGSVRPYRRVDCISRSLSEITGCRHLLERFCRSLSSPLEQLEGATVNSDLKILHTDFVGILSINKTHNCVNLGFPLGNFIGIYPETPGVTLYINGKYALWFKINIKSSILLEY